jgi:hypothetical protein
MDMRIDSEALMVNPLRPAGPRQRFIVLLSSLRKLLMSASITDAVSLLATFSGIN